jgi:hypothetical protein
LQVNARLFVNHLRDDCRMLCPITFRRTPEDSITYI